MEDVAKAAFNVAALIQSSVPKRGLPTTDGAKPDSEQVIAFSLVKDTRGYIEQVVNQINGCYEDGWFDACAVMIRRLTETLIIECFEAKNAAATIKNQAGDYVYLSDLVTALLGQTAWGLGRNAKRALPNLKDVGDKSAHSRRFTAHRSDIDKLIPDLRVVVQELLYLSGLK